MSAPNAAITYEVNEEDTSHFGRIMPPFVLNERALNSIETSSMANGLHSSTGSRILALPQIGEIILNVQNTKDYTKAAVGIKVSSGVGLEVDAVTCPVLGLVLLHHCCRQLVHYVGFIEKFKYRYVGCYNPEGSKFGINWRVFASPCGVSQFHPWWAMMGPIDPLAFRL